MLQVVKAVLAVLLALALIAQGVDAGLRKKKTHAPSMSAPTSQPAVPRQAATGAPSFQKTAEQYYYYAKLYYDRAKFDYDNFPHQGPAFYNAQMDEARGKYYEARAKLETAMKNQQSQTTKTG